MMIRDGDKSRRKAMNMTRRDLAVAGVLALGAVALVAPATADAAEEAAVKDAVEALRKAVFEQDKAKMEGLVADELTYGHSSAVVQTKAEMINGVMTRKAKLKSLEYPELKVTVAGNAAWARHLYVSESELDGKPSSIKIGILEVWQKQAGGWKLLARQGYKLPAA
jgi:ketosteroid isomerase-like protein